MTDPPWILSTESYRTITGANSQSPVLRWFLNSMIAATANAPLILVTASMAAYALARMSFRGKNIMFAVIIATLFTPPFVFLMPNSVLVESLRWLDTLLAMIV